MKVTFREVRYKNLLATGSVFTTIRLDKNESTLVTGRNGSGKSTMLEAISLALYGKPYREINKPALVNTINNKNCEAEIDFDIGAKKYTVKRGIKPNLFEIIVDGEPLDQNAASGDQQAYLEDVILQMSHKTFIKIAVIGNATYKPFMKFNAAERRAMVDELLDVGIYTKMAKVLKTRADTTKQKLRDLETELSIQVSKIDMQKSYIQNLNDDRTAKIEANREKIDTSLAAIDEATAELDTLTASRDKLTATITNADALNVAFDQLRELRQKLNSNSSALSTEIAFFQDHDDCPTCKQSITEEFKTEAIGTKSTKLADTSTALEKLLAKMTTIKAKIDAIAETNREISKIDSSIREVNSNVRTEQQYVAKLQKDIASEEAAPTVDIDAEKIKLKGLAKEAIALTKSKDEEQKQKHLYDLAAIMLKDTGIKSKVIQQYLPVINTLINEFLQELDFFVGFEFDEQFTETIRSRGRDLFAYESFSEGEKKKIDTAILFTWVTLGRLKNTVSTNLLIFDETFDIALDHESVCAVVSILDDIAKEDANIFVISHHPEAFYDSFERHLKFEKVNNYSVMV